ncbi:MAG: hypothetical protein LBQ76_05210 [Candidatus Fibromonas sp.]|nr:hypothetical protein [Candidatus Fibromonas sp.]
MSTEASLFPIHFFDSEIFCQKCAHIRKFKVFSQEKYDKTYGKSEIPPNKPLFCKCEECNDTVIYATNEFLELQEEPTLGLCKIWGMANLETGDMVFHPEYKLCAVDSMNRISGSLPQITLINQKKEKIEIQLESQPVVEQNANVFYRLFPQNSQNARIGDQIYHTNTERIGKVIGLEFNGGQNIIIKYENGDIEKYHCEKLFYYLTDEVLELNAKWRCRDLPYSQNLQIYSRSKVLYVNCLAPNFNVVSELNKIISSIPQTRCFIMRIILEISNISSTEIYKELIRNGIYICRCNVELKNQDVFITGFYSVRDTPKNIYRALQKFPVKKIDLDIRMHSEIKTIKTINESDCFIKISRIGKNVHIDGWVKSEKEKKKAKLKAFFCSFSLRIENHLWVIS